MDKIDIETKAVEVKNIIEKCLKEDDESELRCIFKQFLGNSFIRDYYNPIVLDKKCFDFGKFKRWWAIQGMTNDVLKKLDGKYPEMKEQILKEKDIEKFFNAHCCKSVIKRNEYSFCSKLFHTFLPSEFPPVDSIVRSLFDLKYMNISTILTIKRGYELFIKENQYMMHRMRKVLSNSEFSELRAKELSDMRILDMYCWYKGNRKK